MLLTFKLKHDRDFSVELTKARQVAEYAVEHRAVSSANVKHIGLKSAIANQILRKYGNDRRARTVRNVVMTIPGQAVKVLENELYISCLKLHLDISHLPKFTKVNQVECGKELAYVTATVPEKPAYEPTGFIGIDRNATGHVAVATNPATGKV